MFHFRTILSLLAGALIACASPTLLAQETGAGSAQQAEDGGSPMMQQRTPDSPTQEPGDTDRMQPDSQRPRHEDDRAPATAPREPEMTAPGVETERGGSVGDRPERTRVPTRDADDINAQDGDEPEEERRWWRFWE